MNKNSKIYVAGHKGLVGGAIYNLLQKEGYTNVIGRSRAELNLEDEVAVRKFFEAEKPEYVFIAAAKVGGIKDNSEKPAEFIYENLKIQNNLIDGSYKAGVKKLLFMGSACLYPRLSEQPIKEEYYMTGKLEPTNEAYAVAKIAGITMCQSYRKQYGTDFISAVPTNVYGPNDHFELERSHVIPALVRKFYDAKKAGQKDITLWGTGVAIREFIHADDLASATLFLMQNYSDSDIINISTEVGTSIKELSEKMKAVAQFEGPIIWDSTKPDGMPIRMLDGSRLRNLGWKYSIPLDRGLKETYKWFTENTEKYY
jgi:GDP-L-fucose synthase